MMQTWDQSHAYIISAKDINGTNEKNSDMLATASAQLEQISGKSKSKEECDDLYCGIKPTKAPVAVKKTVDDTYPIYSKKTDGPLLTSAKTVEMKTSAGNIHMVCGSCCSTDKRIADVQVVQGRCVRWHQHCQIRTGLFCKQH